MSEIILENWTYTDETGISWLFSFIDVLVDVRESFASSKNSVVSVPLLHYPKCRDTEQLGRSPYVGWNQKETRVILGELQIPYPLTTEYEERRSNE